MKGLSTVVKIIIIVSAVLTAAAGIALIITKLCKKNACKCSENKSYCEEEEALKDFEECCNACYSE